ncbi:MAG: SRPBCC family protein [Chitinophagaceae bacterium]
MKMIAIKVIVVLIAIISVLMVIAMFSKKSYTLIRSITINSSKQNVYAFVRYNRNQPSYSKWLSFDPDTKIELKGAEDGTPGAILAFNSKNHKTGTGEWEIKNIVPGERVDFELRFQAPFAFTANGYFATTETAGNQTTLQWVYNSGMKWPQNVMLLFMNMDKVVGTDIEASLMNIKKHLEK